MQIIITDPDTKQAIACHGRSQQQINQAISELSGIMQERLFISVYPETAEEKEEAYGKLERRSA